MCIGVLVLKSHHFYFIVLYGVVLFCDHYLSSFLIQSCEGVREFGLYLLFAGIIEN